jgi:predicted dehydrogenase
VRRPHQDLPVALGHAVGTAVDEAELPGPGQVEGGRARLREQLEAERVRQAVGDPGDRQGSQPLPHRRPADGLPRRGLRQNDLFAFQARAFLEQVAGIERLPPCPSFEDGLRNLRLLEAVVASATAGGAEVEVAA